MSRFGVPGDHMARANAQMQTERFERGVACYFENRKRLRDWRIANTPIEVVADRDPGDEDGGAPCPK